MTTKTDSLSDRIKLYEGQYTQDSFLPMLPVIARLDGRSFSKFTKGLEKPFDSKLSKLMIETTKFLVQETDARCGYTQSDEISLVWLSEDWGSEIFFARKVLKMNSILASMTSVFFNKELPKYLPDMSKFMPLFDCRVFQVPNKTEAVNCFVWREQDATRNSKQMVARSVYSHSECENKDGSDLQEMLHSKGINWNDYPSYFKRGTYVRKREVDKEFTFEELQSLPEKHIARQNPNLKIKRTVVMEEKFPIITAIVNREDVILKGTEPILR